MATLRREGSNKPANAERYKKLQTSAGLKRRADARSRDSHGAVPKVTTFNSTATSCGRMPLCSIMIQIYEWQFYNLERDLSGYDPMAVRR